MNKLNPLIVAALLLGCGIKTGPQNPQVPEPEIIAPLEVGSTAESLVGPDGGEIEVGTATISIPANALDRETMIQAETVDAGSAPFAARSAMLRLSPEGLELKVPLRLTIPFDDEEKGIVSVLRDNGLGVFVAEKASVESNTAEVEMESLASVYVGTTCEGDDCCDAASSKLDMLIAVDKSGSMIEEQRSIAREMPALIEAITTGDVDGDGTQDFPAADSIQLGVVSSDLGAGKFPVSGCSGDGDGARLLTAPPEYDTPAECADVQLTDGPFGRYDSGDAVEPFAQTMGCIARVGNRGCGFEQQLESMHLALENKEGLIRDDSVLGVVMISDEDDCSADDLEVYNRDSGKFVLAPQLINLRCNQFREGLHPTGRYVDSIKAIKSPDKVVFTAIAGVPMGIDTTDLGAVLAHPDMQYEQDIDPPGDRQPGLVPACSSTTGVADPSRRQVKFAQQAKKEGVAVTVSSICEESFQPAIESTIAAIAKRMAGSCE